MSDSTWEAATEIREAITDGLESLRLELASGPVGDPLLYLTGCALTGLCGDPTAREFRGIGQQAVTIAAETLQAIAARGNARPCRMQERDRADALAAGVNVDGLDSGE